MKTRMLIVIAAVLAANTMLAEDSPLVAAAKKANRSGKKSTIVITNETLSQIGASAHVTTTKTQKPLANVAPSKVAEQPKATKQKVETRAADALKKPKKRQRDDAEVPEDNIDRGDLVACSTCLPILDKVPASLPMQKAEPSTNPPRMTPPQTPPEDNP
jgi:hypothetical protein